ncbi:MAG: DUF1549 domain-containing protein [Roseibacillus sp.]
MRHVYGIFAPLALAATILSGSALVAEEAADRPVSYWNDIRPLLQASCQGCHQPAKAKGDYILTDVPRLIAGGESGEPAVIAKDPAMSFLLEQITPKNGKAEMPLKDAPLHETEIALIRRWILEGALDDTPENAHQKYDMENPPVYAVAPVVTSLDYSPDGSLLAVAGFHEVLLHKADGSGQVARLVGLSERIESVKFSPDGTMLAVTGGLPGRMGEVQVWDVAKKKLKVSVPVTYDTVYGASWSPDNKLVAFGCGDNTLRAIQVSNGKQVLFMGGHNDWVLDTVFSRDGKQVISVARDMTAKHTEVETERLIENLTSITPGALKGGISAVAGHPEKDEILVGGSDGVPQVFRLKRETARKIGDNANVVRKFPAMKGRIWDVDFGPAGKRIAATSSLNGSGSINIYSSEYSSEIPGDMRKIFAKTPNAADKKKLEEYWGSEVKVLHAIEIPECEMFSVAFSPDGRMLAASGADGTIRFVDVESGKITKTLVPVPVDGTKVVAEVGKGGVKPLNRKRGKHAELGERKVAPGEVTSLQVEPREIAFGGSNEYVHMLVTATLKNGGVADVTRQVKVDPAGGLVEVSDRGRVQPLRDGQGTLVVSLGGQKINIQVHVAGSLGIHVPEYVRDVKPVISRMGCDAGTCHGAKDGKNGFKLSLRGYDPIYDVRAFTDDISARRVNYASPDDSLMLLKATGAVPHEGQQVTQPHSEYYNLIRDWIANGAELKDHKQVVKGIEVYPKNPVIQEVGGQQQIRVVATYLDGTKRDVTRESFVESANRDVAMHDDYGLMTTLRRGEAPVLARYEGSYAATTLTVMGDRSGFEWKEQPAYNEIDKLVADKWERMKILPSGLCSDEEFLRRVYLDLTGLPPSPLILQLFIADETPSERKRGEIVDQLIGSPEFIEHWTNKWADMLMVNSKYLGGEGAKIYRSWIRAEVEKNTPYDEFAYKILTASGSNKENPPASYFKIHRTPDLLMENTTHLFLATRFNCNKCHDHPFERWTQDQYYEIAAYFAQVKLEADGKNSGKKKIGGTAVEGAKPLYEITKDVAEGEVKHERTGEVMAPSFPYAVKYENPKGAGDKNPTRREKLAAWMTAPDNDYFALSYANRIWGYLLGTGIIEPLDDIRAGNPPSNPDLLNWLTEDFVKNGFDVRKLMATICKSRTYQLSLATNKWNEDDEVNFSHAKARRLPAEVLFDTVYAVTGSTPRIPGVQAGTRANMIDARQDLKSGLLANLGRPTRESACECDRSNDVQLGAVMALLSGPDIADAVGDGKNAIAKLVADTADDKELIKKIYLRLLNRVPSSAEVEVIESIWAEIQGDHEKMVAELAMKEQAWLPVRNEREGKRQAGIEKARTAITDHQSQHEKERKRLVDERLKRIADAKKAVSDYEAILPKKAEEFEAAFKANEQLTKWHLVTPATATASDKSKVEILPDGSVRGSGQERVFDYLVTGETKLTNITGIMIEVVPDPTFRGAGAGLNPDGNLVLTELQARWKKKAEGEKEMGIAFSDAKATHNQKDFDVKRAFDGNLDKGNKAWALHGANLQLTQRATFKLKEVMSGDAEGVNLTVGVLCRFQKYPVGRFRVYVTTDPDPLSFGVPAHVAATMTTEPASRSEEQKQRFAAWVGERDAEYQKRRFGVKGSDISIPPDKKMEELNKALKYAELPIEIDPRLVSYRKDVQMSTLQAKNPRLTAAQDLTWALINNPAFLFNH